MDTPVVARLGGAPRWVLVAIALYVAGLILAGILLHPIKAYGVENDDYVSMADTVLSGHLPWDPFRPLLYVLACAGVGWVVGSCFVGAKIVSALAAGLLLLATFALAERCAGRRAAPLATALAASNGWIVAHGMQAGTDMLAAGLAVAALVAAMRVWDQPSRRHLVALGAWLAFAWFTRYTNATLLLPALLACCTPHGPGTGWLARVRRCGIVAATAAVCLVPHFVLTHAVFGSIVYDENWRTVAMKYEHGLVFSRLFDEPTGSVAGVLARDPWGVLSRSLQDLRCYFGTLLVSIVQGSWPTDGGVVATVVAVAGVLVQLLRRGSNLWLPVVHLLVAAVALCVLFLPEERFVLANVPIVCLGLASAVCWLPGGRLRWIRGAVACASLGFVGWNAALEVEHLRRRHPWPEVETARRLHDERAVPFRLLTTYGFLASHLLPDRCAWTQPPYAGEDLSAYGNRLVAQAEELGAAFVLFGRVTCTEPMFRALLEWSHPRLRVRERTDEVRLVEVVGIELDWVARMSASPLPVVAGGNLDIEVVLRDEVPLGEVDSVRVCCRGPQGERVLLPLQPAAERVYRITVPVPPVPRAAAGTPPAWTIEPIVCSTSGRFGGGQPLTIAPQ